MVTHAVLSGVSLCFSLYTPQEPPMLHETTMIVNVGAGVSDKERLFTFHRYRRQVVQVTDSSRCYALVSAQSGCTREAAMARAQRSATSEEKARTDPRGRAKTA